ncbi:MAG: transglutaminase-like domain-containing protein, partial [Ilumatobacteraceae bacterium]
MASESAWLAETEFIDHGHPAVSEFVARALDDLSPSGPTEVAVGLFEQVRDSIRYDPYRCSRSPGEYRASHTALSQSNWCVPKSVLLCAAARSQGIPARLGFADVRNHLTTERLQAAMGTDVFMWHGYAEVLLDGRWFKLSTAFNIELCERFGVGVLHFVVLFVAFGIGADDVFVILGHWRHFKSQNLPAPDEEDESREDD